MICDAETGQGVRVLKIAIVSSYYSWPPSSGGVETVVKQTAIELALRGHEVHVVSSSLAATTRKEASQAGIEQRDGVILHKLQPGRLRLSHAQSIKGLKQTIEKIKPDIVHSHNLHPHLFQLIGMKSQFNYKLVCELHYPIANLESRAAKAVIPITLRYLSSKSDEVDCFIAHAEIEREWLVKHKIADEKISTILFPFVSRELSEYARKENSESGGDLLFVGRVVPIKGVDVLIDAMGLLQKNLPETRLTIVGPCKEPYLEHIKLLVDAKKLQDKVVVKGVVSESQKYELMKNSKAIVLPSLGDFTPGVLIEGQAMGLPAIATKVGAVPEIVSDGQTGILVQREIPKN